MKKFEQLLTTIIDESTKMDSDGNKITLKVPKYNLSVEIVNLADNEVTINFVTNSGSEQKEVKIYTTIPEIKDILSHYYQKKSQIDNGAVIAQIGLETYNKWIAEDLELLSNPVLNHKSPITYSYEDYQKTVYLHDKTTYTNAVEVKKHFIKNGNTQKGEEVIYFPMKKSEIAPIRSVRVLSNHCYLVDDTLYSRQITLHIPMCMLESYPVINQYYPVTQRLNTENGFEKLMEMDTGFGKLVTYIQLENTLGITGNRAKKTKI